MSEALYSIGVDMGGTNTDIGLVSPAGVCIDRSRISTQAFPVLDDYVSALADEIRNLLNSNKITHYAGVGIGAPNAHFLTGTINNAVNLPWRGRIFFADLMERVLAVKVRLDNDANAAAYGEMIYGGARKMQNFIMITLGTGVGSGIVVERKVVYGSTGMAGELGHAILFPEGRLCTCGRRGCLEEYASARGIVKNFRELAEHYTGESLLLAMDLEQVSCRSIGDAALANDALAQATIQRTAYCLGTAIANAATYTSPEAVFLMGGPTHLPNLLEKTQEVVENQLLPIYKGTLSLERTHLNDNDAAILGAAAITMLE